jgi:uncharacterized membrane protein
VLVPADNSFAVWAVLFAGAAFAAWAERTRWGRRLSGVLVAILVAMVLSNLRIIPRTSPTYDAALRHLIPIAIPLLLFGTSLRRILRDTGWMLAAFLIGAAGTILGALIAAKAVPLGADGPRLAGMFAGTYIGGGLNFMAVAQTTQLTDGARMAAAIAADNLVTALYIMGVMALPSLGLARRLMPSPVMARAAEAHGAGVSADVPAAVPLDKFALALALALAFAMAATGYWLAGLTGLGGFGILFVSALALLPGQLAPSLATRLAGHEDLGMIAVYMFLFVMGASADVWTMVGSALPVFLFALLIVTIHMAVVFGAGALLKLDLATLVIASNACVGGSTSAGPLAAARGWQELVTPGILCGALGNAIGTFIGVGVTTFLAR